MLLIDKFMIACCLRDILHQRYEQNLRLQAQGSHHKGHTHFDLLFFMDLPFLHVKKHCDTTSFVYMNRNTCWSERWLSKVFQESRVVHLIDVARKFEFGAVMQDVVCSLHLATFTQIW